jgi:hypothetical protein
MAAPAGWATVNAGAYYRCWKRAANGAIVFEEHPVQATVEQRAQNVVNDAARRS